MQIQNPDVGKTLRDEANVQLAEIANVSISPNVQAVLDVTPSHQPLTIIGSASRSTTGSSGVINADTTADYIIKGIFLSATCDATADVTEFWIGGTINGVASTRLCSFQKTTLTAFTNSIYIPIPDGFILKAGSTVTINHAFTVGTSTIRGILYGFKRLI